MARIPWVVAWLVAIIIMVIALADRVRAEQPVDVALVLAVDVSFSVDDAEWALQRDGLADAIGSDIFARVISAGHHGRIAVALIQWSRNPHPLIGWRVVGSPAAALALAAEIRAMPRAPAGHTCVARALAAATVLLEPWRDLAGRRIVDVSGDGANNCSDAIDNLPLARGAALAAGITVNGLAIVTAADRAIADWYQTVLIGGPGAFVVVAQGFESFAEAFLRKLVVEIAEAR